MTSNNRPMSSEMRELIAKWRAVAEKQRGMASRDNERGDLECAARMAGMAERTEYMADELEALLARTEAGAVAWMVEVDFSYHRPPGRFVFSDKDEAQAYFDWRDGTCNKPTMHELFTHPQDASGDAWKCYVGEMQTSAGMRYVVTVERESEQAMNFWDRTRITPHIFGDGERYKAEYEAACLSAFLNNTPCPDILAFKPDAAMQAKEAK